MLIRRHKEMALKAKEEVAVPVVEEEIIEEVVIDYDSMTKQELKEQLDSKGIEYSHKDSKEKLLEILKLG